MTKQINLGKEIMIKQIAWNTFKNTGNINTMLELIKTDEELNKTKYTMNNTIIEPEESTTDGSDKNKRNSFSNT